jgi:hypothetical protein
MALPAPNRPIYPFSIDRPQELADRCQYIGYANLRLVIQNR